MPSIHFPKKFLHQIGILILLLLLSYPAVKSLLVPGGFTAHDLTHHIVRQIDIDKLLKEGQFPPRWSGDLASKFGYPIFMFYYPLPALLGEPFHLMGFNFLDSVKAVLFLSLVLSPIGMYLFLRSLLNSSLAAFLGAVFYLYNPIHLLVVYVSGSTGAALGLVFPPFILWSIVKLWHKRDDKFLLLGAGCLAALILSHNITAFLFAPIILTFVIVLKLLPPQENHHFIRDVLLMFFWGLFLSAWFWLPAMLEKQYIRYDQIMKGFYINQFPTLSQIIYSPWGYGLSHPKTPAGGLSYQVGLIHWAVMLLFLPCLFFLRRKKEFLLLGLFALGGFIVSIFFMLEISLPFWDHLPLLGYVQAPVRILIISTFCASLVAALLIKYLFFRRILFIILLVLVFYANRNHLGVNQKFNPGEDFYKSLSTKSSTTSFDEDLPIWVKKIQTNQNHDKFSFLKGEGTMKIMESKSVKVLAEIDATTTAKIRFNQYYFPGWQIQLDQKIINFDYLTEDNSGLPVFDISSGKHLILAEFKSTQVRQSADTISLIAVILWIVLLCKLLVRR